MTRIDTTPFERSHMVSPHAREHGLWIFRNRITHETYEYTDTYSGAVLQLRAVAAYLADWELLP